MGTAIEVLLPESREDAARGVEALFGEWHAKLTRFDEWSELMQLNARAGSDAQVSPFLFRVVEASLRAAAATHGYFDPTLLGSMERLGYDRTFALVLPDDPRPVHGAPVPTGAWREVRLDPDRLTVRLPAGTGLDLGGIAKGMAADAALELIGRDGISRAAIDAGGDIAVLGLPPADPAIDGWPVGIELPAPDRSGGSLRSLTLYDGALATSSVARRWWRRGGVRLHHLIDPRTGLPVENGVWSVSVAASRCEQAEVAAKAAFVLGPEAGGRFLDANGLAGLFILEDGREIEVGPWRMRPGDPASEASE